MTTTPEAEATMTETDEIESVLRQIKKAHAGNYGLRHYLSHEQKLIVEAALAAMSRPAPTPAEAPIDNWHGKPIEELLRGELVDALTWSVNRQRELLRELSELRPAPTAKFGNSEAMWLDSPAPAAEVTGEREAWITECCKHIKICADVWELSGVSRVRTITKAADDILKALTTPSPDAGRVPEGREHFWSGKCQFCEARFFTKWALEEHERAHDEVKSWRQGLR